MADIRATQGHLAEAVTNFLDAIRAYDLLLVDRATNLTWRFERSRVNSLGIAHARRNEFDQARQALMECLRQRQELLQLLSPRT